MWFVRCLAIALTGAAISLAVCSSDGNDGNDAGGDAAPACVAQGGACSNGQRCCAGLACCSGVPVQPGQEFCGANCPIARRVTTK